ncbi:MAG TPA: S1 RNA-binding domain-containing protein [Roseiflexaceae bacterium]|nr:S1 RNA-binding domain-containing protein [Roseiflexaceae bacterium]
MTNQERPVGEQEELRQDEPETAQVAVAEQAADEAQQNQTAEVDGTAQPAAAEAGASVDVPQADAQTAGASVDVPQADAQTNEQDDAAASAEREVGSPYPSVDAALEQATPAEAVEPDSAAQEASEAEASYTSEAEAEASYSPVAEETGGKPRRVKDLQAGMELEGRVTSIALYGIFVDIGVGRDGLVHISEMSDTRIDSPSDIVQIGDTVRVRVKSVEPDGRRISLTMRTPEGQSRGRGRKKPDLDRDRLSTLRVGDTVEGTVTGIAPFGVFVDIGVGKDGLVHISELSETRVEKAEDAVQVGQSYTFKLLEVDAEGTRISLSLRRAQRAQRMQSLEKGQILEGTVSGISPFGAFVDIGVGRDGLVHISELSDERVAKVEDVVKVGDRVQVRVLEADSGSKRISLSMRLEDRPRAPREENTADEVAPQPRAAAQRAAQARVPRDDRGGPREDRRRDRPSRRDEPRPASSEYYSTPDEEEDAPTDNATLEDLLSKYGNGNRRNDRRRRTDEVVEEDSEDRNTRRQRDAIRRTIQQLNDDE